MVQISDLIIRSNENRRTSLNFDLSVLNFMLSNGHRISRRHPAWDSFVKDSASSGLAEFVIFVASAPRYSHINTSFETIIIQPFLLFAFPLIWLAIRVSFVHPNRSKTIIDIFPRLTLKFCSSIIALPLTTSFLHGHVYWSETL